MGRLFHRVTFTMSSSTDFFFALPRHTKVLMVMDVVESVRLMEQGEDDFVARWQQLVGQAEQQLLPLHGGRLVKSLGDGLMLEFADAHSCIRAAFALQELAHQANHGRPAEEHMQLRVGAHVAEFVADRHDIYGADVNLTARIVTLAGPGEIVVTSDLRDQMTAGFDADVEDLGECHLKHVKEPVRAYRVTPTGQAPLVVARESSTEDFRPTIAVIPFEARSNEPEHFVIGELIADGIIAQLSRNADIRVISRLSTTAFRGRTKSIADVESRLAASFVLSGSYVASGGRILIMAELASVGNNEIVWADRLSGDTLDLLQAQSEMLDRIATATSKALVHSEVKRSLEQPLPRLDSGALLLGGISLMHRSSLRDFDRSRQVLEALVERHGRAATPRAWLAKWYTLRVVRGMSDKPAKDAQLALEQTRRALDLAPDNALSLAIEGYARCQLLGQGDVARDRIEQAIELNPNEPLGWLYKSVWSTMWGTASNAVTEAKHAATLSPIDPLKYFFDVILASAQTINLEYSDAVESATRSLKESRDHQPTLRVLLQAQVESGSIEAARETLRQLIRVVPNLTVSSYLSMGSSSSTTRQRFAEVLRKMGVPEV